MPVPLHRELPEVTVDQVGRHIPHAPRARDAGRLPLFSGEPAEQFEQLAEQAPQATPAGSPSPSGTKGWSDSERRGFTGITQCASTRSDLHHRVGKVRTPATD